MPGMSPFEEVLARLLARIEELGWVSETPDALTRTFLSTANLEAAGRVAAWMQEAGMTVSHDPGGTVRGVLEAKPEKEADPDSPPPDQPATLTPKLARPPLSASRPLLLGSHLDTVIDAGKYDGALGVLIALAALEITGPLEFPVHVLGFSDEEGVRFHATYLGSRACVGEFDDGMLALKDAKGVTLREALESGRRKAEGVLKDIPLADFHYAPGEARGYVEVHIEQGRVLEVWNEPVCAVSAICGQSRLLITLNGQADHAGTTPMEIRKDALAGAAECILATERIAREHPELVATVGKLDLKPGASNAIPGEVRFTLDFRHPTDHERETQLAELLATFARIAEDRELEFVAERVQDTSAVSCDSLLTQRLLAAAKPFTGAPLILASGAGHDGVMMATAMPIAMLFVRCREGLSHHPDEFASPEDIAVALRVLVAFLERLSEDHRRG